MTGNEKPTPAGRRKSGRPPKIDKTSHCVMVRFNSREFANFLTLHEKSGEKCRAHFIKKRILGGDFRVVKVDSNTLEFYQTLKDIKAECRKIGVNYNQYITILRTHFTEQRAAMMSQKSAQLLTELHIQNEKALQITLQLVRKWLPK